MTSRERVYRTLDFDLPQGRAPRQLWVLPWAETRHPRELRAILADYPSDFAGAPVHCPPSPVAAGDPYAVGASTDDWGCVFESIQAGIIGEVRRPIIANDSWSDLSRVHVPREWLDFDIDDVNRACAAESRFVMAGCCPRPFERLQFLRGSAELLMDLMDPPPAMLAYIARLHAFYCELLEAWARTDVDALQFMDDWGTQRQLLINPALWDQYFRPLYRDYIDIAHRHGKRIFMHSDGQTLAILPALVELGLDAINAQLFCIGVEKLAPFRGRISFWGEIDRQHLLPQGSTADIDRAVREVYETLWQDGGCIAQCEFGPGARPENVRQVFASWDALTGGP